MLRAQYKAIERKVIVRGEGIERQYQLIPEKHCNKCGKPYATQDNCYNHRYDLMDKTLPIGSYYPTRMWRYMKDDLSKDIVEFKSDMDFGPRLGLLMITAIKKIYPELKKFDAIVPIPRTKEELKEDHNTKKKYDPQLLLAHIVSKYTGINVVQALKKVKPYHQYGKSLEERRQIIANAEEYFELADDCVGRGDDIILIDDVRTTGSTGSACAKVLRKAKVGKIYLFVLGITV